MTKEEVLAEKVIKDMRESGLTYGEILRAIRLAKEKLDKLRQVKR